MSRRANKIRKQIRAEEIAQEKRLTDGNSDWKRLGSRDTQHAKHTPNHSPYDNNGNGSRPPRALEVFYDLTFGEGLVRYEKIEDVPPGQKPVVVDGHIFVYLPDAGRPVSRIPYRLNVEERHFWPGKYTISGRSLLHEIGGQWILDSDRSKAYTQLRTMTEKLHDGPTQAPPAAHPKLETLAASPTMLVVYHDYPNGNFGITHPDRHILVLDTTEVPGDVLDRHATKRFELLGYNAAYFIIDSSHAPDTIAKTLGIAPNNIRVGHYSDYGGNFLDDVLKGNSFAASSAREILKIANIPRRNGTPSEKSHGGI